MASKRERAPNWNIPEITLLQELVEKDEDILKAKQTNTLTNAKKNEKWSEITTKINATCMQNRTVEQVKYKWGNLQQNAKKTFSDMKKQRKQTGGGPAPKAPSAVEEKIINLMKDRPNFSGIVGGFESSMPPDPVHEIGLTEKAKRMHNEINVYLDNYNANCSSHLPKANDKHLIRSMATSPKDNTPPECQIDDLANYLCANYPRLQDFSSQDVSSLLHNTVQFITNYRQGGTPNSSYVESEETSSSNVPEDLIDIDCSTILCESVATELPKEPNDLLAENNTSSTTVSSISSIPEGKRKRVSLNDLQNMQYEVLKRQKIQIDLQNIKTQKEIDRENLTAENLRLQNKKLTLEIQMMQQNISREDTAILALSAIQN